MDVSEVAAGPCLMDVVIFAGSGEVSSSDLGSLTAFEPKSMLMICNRPLIWYCLLPWVQAGFHTFFVCVNEDNVMLRAYLTRELPNIEFHFIDVPLKVNDHNSTTCDCVKAFLEYKQHLRSGNRHMPDSPILNENKSEHEETLQHHTSGKNDSVENNKQNARAHPDLHKKTGSEFTAHTVSNIAGTESSGASPNNGSNRRGNALRLELIPKSEQHEQLSMSGLVRDAILINCDTILAGINIEQLIHSFYTSMSSVTALFFKPANRKAGDKIAGAGTGGSVGAVNANNTRSGGNNAHNLKKSNVDSKNISGGKKIGAGKLGGSSAAAAAVVAAMSQLQISGNAPFSTAASAATAVAEIPISSLYHAPQHTFAHSFTAVGYEERDFVQSDDAVNGNCFGTIFTNSTNSNNLNKFTSNNTTASFSNREASIRLASPTNMLNVSHSKITPSSIQPLPNMSSVSSPASLMEEMECNAGRNIHHTAEPSPAHAWASLLHAAPLSVAPRLHRMHYMANMEDKPEVRVSMSFAARRPDLVFSANLVDAHVYCVRSWVLQYIASSAKVAETSVRRTVIPLLARSQHASVNLAQGKFASTDKKIKFAIPSHWMHEDDEDKTSVDQLNAVHKSMLPYSADKLKVYCAICEEDDRLPCKVYSINNTENYRAVNEEIIAAKGLLSRWRQLERQEGLEREVHLMEQQQHSPCYPQTPNVYSRGSVFGSHALPSPTMRIGNTFIASPIANSPRHVDEQLWRLMSACATSTLQPDSVMNVKKTIDKWFVNIEDSFVDCEVPINVTITRSVIGANVLLSDGVRIIDSIILANVEIGSHTLIARSVIGTSAVISAKCKVTNSVIGPRCMVESDVKDNTVE